MVNDTEWLKIVNEKLKYSPFSNDASKRLFLRTIKKSPKALREAHAFFGLVDNVYRASSDTLSSFVYMHYGTGSLGAETRLKQDIRKNIRENR